ncbi:uncharacterized protein LOC129289142 [Prosopis cineraria]|uniref:uncharacterized protein LOC129289142 n=1 Tax=Prosopis cineraria TaxID=364024 RepID=UPI00240F9805|nr:uncharacterized protein LOC129289142 [Prosopis cineraria]
MTREEAEASPKLIRGIISLCGYQIDALFDSSATHSFVSNDYAKRLNLHMLEMPFSINVSTLVGASVRTSRTSLKLELKFSDRVIIIDLICLPLSGIDVIIEMDWFFANGATLDVIERGIDRIDVVNEFPEVFDDRVSRLPSEREIEFFIDLVPNTEPISKAPYRMAPVELEELKKQL